MKGFIYTLYAFFLQAVLFSASYAQGLELRLNGTKNCGEAAYCVDLNIQAAASSTGYELGTSSVFLQYNADAIAFRDYTPARFDEDDFCEDGSINNWATHQYDAYSHPGQFNLVLYLTEDGSNCPTVLADSPISIGTICFDILQQGGHADLQVVHDHTHFNSSIPNNGNESILTTIIPLSSTDDELACDCPGIGVPCNDQNVYTVNDQYDIYCNCNGVYQDTDQDGVLDGVDACLDLTYQAEDATYEGPIFRNNEAQFFGIGYLDYANDPSHYTEFLVEIAESGKYTLRFRYTSNTANRSLHLSVDGSTLDEAFPFPATGTWENWQESTLDLDLSLGQHSIRLSANGTYGPNLDQLTVSICNDCTLTGQYCDDGDPCTTDDVYDVDCNCGGRISDEDGDQIPDACDTHIGTPADMPLETGMVANVGDEWQTITLDHTYNSMVVVATPHLPNADAPPVVTRVRNAFGNSFEIRIQNPSGSIAETYNVFYLVVEEGTYQEAYDGIKLEARTEYAELTADYTQWNQREQRGFRQNYSQPVVLGQVMSDNNDAWSVFWASSADTHQEPPTASSFAAGKHKGEDAATARDEEIIGIVVIEQGIYQVRDKILEAGLGEAAIGGPNNNGYQYLLNTNLAKGAVLSVSGINGGNGYWPVLFGPEPISPNALTLVADEDQVLDEERSHALEQVAFLAFEVAICLDDADGDGVCDAEDICPDHDDLLDTDGDGLPNGCDDCDNSLTGRPCDDGNTCTILDNYTEACGCFGIPMDSDGDGVCNWDDLCQGSDDNIDTDGDGIPDGCDPNVGDAATMPLETGLVSGVGDGWITVVLDNNYTSMVVVATVHLPNDDLPPVVTRIRNVGDNSFELKVQNPSGPISETYDVYYFAIEEGVYKQAFDGVKMEARRVSSASTAGVGTFNMREERAYQQNYERPVVLGQVMSANDERWSVFWSSLANSQSSPPSATSFAAGKHIGADTITTRAVETLGLIIIEEGSYALRDQNFEARVGADTIGGLPNNTYNTYDIQLNAPKGAVLSATGIDGGDGYWPVLEGDTPFEANKIHLACDEDQISDSERSHTDEQVAFLVFEDRQGCNLELFVAATSVSCHGANDGRATVGTSGAQGDVSIEWSNGAATAIISDLSPGTYGFTITDDAGCTLSREVLIEEPSAIEIETTTTITSCFGSADGTASAEITGGIPPYTYAWSMGASLEIVDNLEAGIYQLTVTDGNGCQGVVDGIQVLQPANLEIESNITSVVNGDGAIDISVTGGTPNYSYQWNGFGWQHPETSQDLSNLDPGTYWLTVTDGNGCNETASYSVYPNDVCVEQVYQAEDAQFSGPVVLNDLRGYTGDGYLRMGFTPGEYLEFMVNVPEQGTYRGMLRYSLKWNNNRPMALEIDGQHQGILFFQNTGSWENWQLQEFVLSLEAGAHTLRFLTYTTINSWHHPWIDLLTICSESDQMIVTTSGNTLLSDGTIPVEELELTAYSPNTIAEGPESVLLLYPNPATQSITIEADVPIQKDRFLTITDVNGKILQTRQILQTDTPWLKQELDVSNLQAGIYFMHLKVGESLRSSRFVLLR